jgi:Tfp pilus assembly protein PilV
MSMARGQRGFTLIEAALAVLIMGLCGFALLGIASRCLAVAHTARNYHSAASVLAAAQLDYPLQPTNAVMDNVVSPHTYEGTFIFSRSVEPLNADEDLFIIRSRVAWPGRGREAFEDVEQLLFSTNHP